MTRPAGLRVPDGLAWWAEKDEGRWLERLPNLVAECAEAWSLELDRDRMRALGWGASPAMVECARLLAEAKGP